MVEFNSHAEKIYKDAGDKDIFGVKVYPKHDAEIDAYFAYYDPEFKHPILKAELEELFYIGMYVVMHDAGYSLVRVPMQMNDDGHVFYLMGPDAELLAIDDT